jgi:hypothetical protein
VVTKQEVWEATRPSVEKNKKKYSRKVKHLQNKYDHQSII